MLKKLLIALPLLCLFLLAAVFMPIRSVDASINGIVISQIYGGGGNAGSTFKNDFVEIFNADGATGSQWLVSAIRIGCRNNMAGYAPERIACARPIFSDSGIAGSRWHNQSAYS